MSIEPLAGGQGVPCPQGHTELVLAAGWKTRGKTPEAALYAVITHEIARKGKDARFKKIGRGVLRDQRDRRLYPMKAGSMDPAMMRRLSSAIECSP